MAKWLDRILGRKPKQSAPRQSMMHLGVDPLDPHGDGTLRPGDPLYDMLMGGTGAVLATRSDDDDAVWHVSTPGEPDEPR